MMNGQVQAAHDAKADGPVPPSSRAILAELGNVLSSAAFRSSRRSQDFLRYVVEKTLAGEADALKERTIGVEVFGKDPDYDVNECPVVRVRAGDIRKRLGVCYNASSHQPEVVIELPAGSYVPRFRQPERRSEQEEAAGAAVENPAWREESSSEMALANWMPHATVATRGGPRGRKLRGWRGLAAAAVFVFLLLTAAGLRGLHQRSSIFEEFWAPVFGSSERVLLDAACTPVWLRNDLGASHDVGYTFVDSGYLGGEDLIAASEISGMLGARHHPFESRIGNSVSFQDLSGAPSILIGYSVHFWDPLTRNFRYTIAENNGMILDNGKPTAWIPRNLRSDLHVDDDYAIVARVFLPQTHEMMIMVYGAEQYGTEAAAELITHPDLLESALRDAPRGWQNRNLQMVLHTKIVDNYPAVPQVVASHYW